MSMEQNKKFDNCKELLYTIIYKELGFSKEQILSKVKKRPLADARRVMIRILKNSCPNAKVSILGQVVARDHSNVSTQLKEHYNLYKNSMEYTEMYDIVNSEYNYILNSNKPLSDLYVDKNNLETRLNIVNKAINDAEFRH